MTAPVTLAQTKTHLNITAPTYDVELQSFVDRATAAAQTRLGHPIVAATVTEVHDGGTPVLLLRRAPQYPGVVTVTTVTENGATVTSGGYVLNAAAGLLHRGTSTSPDCWAAGTQNVTVTYTAGYNPVPDDLQLAVLEMVRHLWTTQRGGMDGRNPLIGDDYQSPGTGWTYPRRVTEILDSYRRTL